MKIAPEDRIHAFNDLFSIQWHITDRCDLACFHCYRKERKEDLDLERLLFVFDKIKTFLKSRNDPGRIHFAGGEPLASPHLETLLQKATEAGMKARILSNGTLVTPERAQKLRAAGAEYVQVSLEGCEGTNDEIRGSGTFQRALEGAKNLSALDIEVTFAMTLSKKNLGDIDDLRQIGAGIARRIYYSRLVPTHDRHREFALGRNEWRQAMAQIVRIREFEVPLRDPTFRPLFLSPEKALRAPAIAGCSLGYRSICIESNGDVYLCRRLPIVIGNVLKDDLEDLWEGGIIKQLRNRDHLRGKCGGCAYRGCAAGAGGLRTPSPAITWGKTPAVPSVPFRYTRILPSSRKTSGC